MRWGALTLGLLLVAGCNATEPTPSVDAGIAEDAVEDTALPDAPECLNPTDCPQFSTCRNGACVEVPCSTDADCGAGNRCETSRCVAIGAGPCDTDDDCGHRWACSAVGVCTDAECATHEDCPDTEWCREAICIPRRELTGAVQLARTALPPITDHVAGEFDALYGWGGALLDFDGDGDLDMFLGTSNPAAGDSPACLYENQSAPGQPAFTAVEALCGPALEGARFGTAIDTDLNGSHELILAGRRWLRWLRFDRQPQSVDLLALLPEEDLGRRCDAGSMVATDLDLDGHLDLLVGCTRRRTDDTSEDGYPNIALRYDPALETFTPLRAPLLLDPGYTLAIGVHDVDRDGLPDLLIANDTFTARDEAANFLPPGSVLFACPPTEDCAYTSVPFDEGDRAWGSFMGLGAVVIDGYGEHIYVSDFGPNRLIQFEGRVGTDRAPALGAEAAVSDPEQILLYGWAVLVDDFDRNGLDDILVTHGHPKAAVESLEYAVQQDLLLLQTAGGQFTALGTEAGLSAPTTEDSLDPQHAYSSRGGARFDLDHDGWMDIVTTGLTGVAKLHTEQPTEDNGPGRCTLIPVHTTAPSMGHSVGVAPEGSDAFRYHQIQGQIRWGTSPWILTTHRRGIIRFPSGAQVPYDCGSSHGPLPVTEPEWLAVSRVDDNVEIALDMTWSTGEAVVEVAHGGEGEPATLVSALPTGPGRYAAALPQEATRVMLRIDGTWLPRWWPL